MTETAQTELRKKAKQFAKTLPVPLFYRNYQDEADRSTQILETSSQLAACKKFIGQSAERLGHGVKHALAVARDAGILIQAEAAGLNIPATRLDELIFAVQVAALLHDIKRIEKNHAQAGAVEAGIILRDLDIPEDQKSGIVTAIRNHEAFKSGVEPRGIEEKLISDVLYDADKFRWGPDNFTDTLWLMMESGSGPSLENLHRRFLQNLEYIRRIKPTFRTGVGRRYGPEFIEQGIEIGKAIYRELSRMMGGPKLEVITDLEQVRGCCAKAGVITLGNFDGLHLGHQELIRNVVKKASEIDGTSIVFTFHPHPLKVLSPDTCPPLISTYEEKVALFEEMGIDLLLMIPFTGELSGMTAYDFAKKILKETLNATEVFVGFNFRFGKGREGNLERLRTFGKELGFNVTELREVTVQNEVVSSTKIRTLLNAGDVEHAGKLLGRPYAIAGRVVSGDKRGRELGFPTANLEPIHEIMPYPGVYAVRVFVEGSQYNGVVNAGFRPTFDKHELCLEVHIFDFSREIYGKEIIVFFIKKIRDEKRFESMHALVEQIKKDVTTAKNILKKSR